MNTQPVVTITGPESIDTFGKGLAVVFTGTAIDAEDGDITAALVWTSDIDGVIGTGGSFSLTTLAVGEHLIIATSTDSMSLVGTARITIRIEIATVHNWQRNDLGRVVSVLNVNMPDFTS